MVPFVAPKIKLLVERGLNENGIHGLFHFHYGVFDIKKKQKKTL